MALRGSRLNWPGLSELKMRWGVSKAAIIYRGHQLGVFSEEQVRAGYIGLKRHGEAIKESEDDLIQNEEPEVISESIKVMRDYFGVSTSEIAHEMGVQLQLLNSLLERPAGKALDNVVKLEIHNNELRQKNKYQ